MPVLSCTIPANRQGPVAVIALLHGVEADLIDTDGETAYVDFIGHPDKIAAVAILADAEIIEENDSVPHDEPVYTMIGRSFH